MAVVSRQHQPQRPAKAGLLLCTLRATARRTSRRSWLLDRRRGATPLFLTILLCWSFCGLVLARPTHRPRRHRSVLNSTGPRPPPLDGIHDLFIVRDASGTKNDVQLFMDFIDISTTFYQLTESMSCGHHFCTVPGDQHTHRARQRKGTDRQCR